MKSSVEDYLIKLSGQPEGQGSPVPADEPSFGPEAISGVLDSERWILSQVSFEIPPDIDSKEVDKMIEKYREEYGPPKIDMERIESNLRRLRAKLRGV